MSSSDRRLFLAGLTALAGLCACGFTPAYGPGGAARGLLNTVAVAAPTDKDSFDLVERLEERLGRTGSPRWSLRYTITTDAKGVAITPENAITRYNLIGSVEYRLEDSGTGAVVSEGTVQSFTSYAASGTPVSTLAAEQDAHLRLMRMLADQIVTRLMAVTALRDAAP